MTQEQLAKALEAKDIHLHAATIAKIERDAEGYKTKPRSVRIDEASAIADVFGISVDTMLGRRARPESDRVYILAMVADTALRSATQIIDMSDAVRDRIADLGPPDEGLTAREDLIAGCERARDALDVASDALVETAQAARRAVTDQRKARAK
jgi:transcriptional regulator with XRE-family HTH domain